MFILHLGFLERNYFANYFLLFYFMCVHNMFIIFSYKLFTLYKITSKDINQDRLMCGSKYQRL